MLAEAMKQAAMLHHFAHEGRPRGPGHEGCGLSSSGEDGAWLEVHVFIPQDKETSGRLRKRSAANRNGQSWLCLDLRAGLQEAWELQSRLVAARKEALLEADVFLLLRHPGVYPGDGAG